MKDGLNMENIKNTYMDELIRENARLTIRHEADRMVIEELTEKADLMETAERAAQEAVPLKIELDKTKALLAKAIADLHFVMAGGDPCKVCTVKCAFGEGNCKPVWRGEEAQR